MVWYCVRRWEGVSLWPPWSPPPLSVVVRCRLATPHTVRHYRAYAPEYVRLSGLGCRQFGSRLGLRPLRSDPMASVFFRFQLNISPSVFSLFCVSFYYFYSPIIHVCGRTLFVEVRMSSFIFKLVLVDIVCYSVNNNTWIHFRHILVVILDLFMSFRKHRSFKYLVSSLRLTDPTNLDQLFYFFSCSLFDLRSSCNRRLFLCFDVDVNGLNKNVSNLVCV